MKFQSALGIGHVIHSRQAPKEHRLKAPLMMPMLDLDSLEQDLAASRWWSVQRRNIAAYYREDYFAADKASHADAVRDAIKERLGYRPNGVVHMLANVRYFGHTFNPITLYFCSDSAGAPVACLAEVTNIPWGQKILYAMPIEGGGVSSDQIRWHHQNAKQMHVSPMMPMQMDYRWRVEYSHQSLFLSIENQGRAEEGTQNHAFFATLNLRWQPLTAANLRSALLRYPAQTMRTVFDIHWHALRLWLKGVPYIPHPHPNSNSIDETP